MKRSCLSRWITAKLIVSELLLWHLVNPSTAIAQIVSDTTLPNNSEVVPTGNGVTINGGTVRGSNLFHSFNQFSVPTGSEAYFNNDGAIANIISRVTGGQVSNIDGLIRANGTANLFLLNPNGIVLGSNARLNIGGAFIASTADSVLFDNDFAFSATNPQAPPLLTINAPIGLQYGSNPGAIASSASGTQLQAASGQMLGLLGGDLSLTGVTLSAPQGRIELGSVGPNSTVSLTPRAAGFAAGYEQVNQFRDIRLAGQTAVDASGNGSGVIRVRGDRVHLTQNSSITSDTLGDGTGGRINITANDLSLDSGAFIASAARSSGPTAEITVTVIDTLNITGETGKIGFDTAAAVGALFSGDGQLFNRRNGIFTATNTAGDASDITIRAGQLNLRNGASIASQTFLGGSGNGGHVTVTAFGAIDLANNSTLSSSTSSNGNAGNIRIDAQRLRVQYGGGVIANSVGSGSGGDIVINADDSVVASSSVRDAPFPTSIVSANSFLGGGKFNIIGTGRGGNVTINTDRLIVRGGAVVSSSAGGFLNEDGTAPRGGRAGNLTVNARRSIEVSGISEDEQFPSLINSTTATTGSAGVLTLNTRRLTVQGGGQVSVSTSGTGGGRGGRLEVYASDRIELSGHATRHIRLQNNRIRLLDSLSGLTATAGFAFFRYPSNSRGGNLRIRTNELIVRNRAEVAVGSVEDGGADSGNLFIRANTVQLRRSGRITAATNSGEGGNIRLNIGNLIMRRDANLSADATTSGNGGNIRINSNFIVGVPTENSDILTGAVLGNGGDINIRTQGIFGLVPRAPNPNLSDISADSQFGLDGVINITTPDVDPSRSTVVLPDNFVDASRLVAQDCRGQGAAIAQNSSAFTVSGRGGIPPTPIDMFDGNSPYVDLETPPAPDSQSTTIAPTPESTVSELGDRIVEAQGWVVASNGTVALTPDVPAAPATTGIRRPSCPTTF